MDYDSITENLVFNAGTTRECRRIPITDDPVDEDDEMFAVTLTTQDENAALAPDETVVTIIDNDGEDAHLTTNLLYLHNYNINCNSMFSIRIYCVILYLSLKDVTIGFERTVTSVGENDGTVEVCAVIRNGVVLERDVRVVLSTQPDTATGN